MTSAFELIPSAITPKSEVSWVCSDRPSLTHNRPTGYRYTNCQPVSVNPHIKTMLIGCRSKFAHVIMAETIRPQDPGEPTFALPR